MSTRRTRPSTSPQTPDPPANGEVREPGNPDNLDPFNPASLRLSQDFGDAFAVKKMLLSVPVRKPPNHVFIRVHPGEDYRLQTAVIETKEDKDKEIFLVAPALWPELAAEVTFSPRVFFTTITRQGVVYFWPIRLPGADGKIDEWSRTALEAAQLAMHGWVRVVSNMSLGAYEVVPATGRLPEPEWPGLTFQQLLRIAFRDRFINTLDHPKLRQLRGEV
jgi:hypothetical protein